MNRIQFMALKLDRDEERHTPFFLGNVPDATVSLKNKRKRRVVGLVLKSLLELTLCAKPTEKRGVSKNFSLTTMPTKSYINIGFWRSYVFMIGEGEHMEVYTAPDKKPR
jgi:hypothetical protein